MMIKHLLWGSFVCGSLAIAAPPTPEATQPHRAPITVQASYLSGTLDLLGVSATGSPVSFLDFELGTSIDQIPIGFPHRFIYFRGGPRYELAGGRDANGRGLTLDGALMVGARYRSTGIETVGPDLAGALTANLWLARYFGLCVRGTVGGALLDEHRTDGTKTWDVWVLFPDLRLSFGLTF